MTSLDAIADYLKEQGRDDLAGEVERAAGRLEYFEALEQHGVFNGAADISRDPRGVSPLRGMYREWDARQRLSTSPPAIDWSYLNDQANAMADQERSQVESFLRDNHADPAIHEHVFYPGPDYGKIHPPGTGVVKMNDKIHSLIPKADLDALGAYPPVGWWMEPDPLWPWRRIYQEAIV